MGDSKSERPPSAEFAQPRMRMLARGRAICVPNYDAEGTPAPGHKGPAPVCLSSEVDGRGVGAGSRACLTHLVRVAATAASIDVVGVRAGVADPGRDRSAAPFDIDRPTNCTAPGQVGLLQALDLVAGRRQRDAAGRWFRHREVLLVRTRGAVIVRRG